MFKKRTETRSQEYSESIINTIREPLIALDQDLRVVTASRSFYEVFKVNPKETVGQLIYDLGNKQWDIPKLRELLETILPQQATFDNYEVEHDFATIGRRIMLLNARQIQRVLGKERIILLAIEDITERRQLEDELLRAKEENFRNIFDNAGDGILLADMEKKKFHIGNNAICRMLGYSPEEIKDLGVMDIHPEKDLPYIIDQFERQAKGEFSLSRDLPLKRKDGTVLYADVNATDVKFAGKNYRMGFFHDITERKRAEGEIRRLNEELERRVKERTAQLETLKESEERYRSLFERVPVGLYRTTSEGQVLDVNPALVRLLGYPSREAMMTIHVADGYGDEKERTRWQTLMEREGVVRGAETQWRRFDGTMIWVRESALAIRDNEGRITHYEGVVEDVTEHRQAEEQLQKSLQQTKKVLEEVVEALSSIVEKRDPYTAGHQRRVAELACAIAGELNLPEVQIAGIRVAGLIHDIGKMNVPAEILSKSGRLSEAEFNIIKTHSQVGKEILESIDFPWPVAQVVHQHHERLNGTGYPQGLSDGKIILEAKIIAVADVVEAMASHRPYRPALGVEKALEEISNQSSVLYDPQVVDACRELFDKKGYKLA